MRQTADEEPSVPGVTLLLAGRFSGCRSPQTQTLPASHEPGIVTLARRAPLSLTLPPLFLPTRALTPILYLLLSNTYCDGRLEEETCTGPARSPRTSKSGLPTLSTGAAQPTNQLSKELSHKPRSLKVRGRHISRSAAEEEGVGKLPVGYEGEPEDLGQCRSSPA